MHREGLGPRASLGSCLRGRLRLPPLAHFVRARLHRRLFAWFAATILFTALMHIALFHFVGVDSAGRPPALLGLSLTALILWLAAGKIARRLARPIAEVARVAHEIGRGKLGSRAALSCGTPDEVGVLATAVNDMAQRIERQLGEQRFLLAQVSHEMRTPLGHLRILIELLRENGPDPKTIDELEREVVEMDRLVGELLASSRLEFQVEARRPLSPVELGQRAIERAGLPRERLASALPSEEVVEGDATLLQRALANLIDNAKKHGGGLEELALFKDDGALVFEARDRGGGIPPGDEERIFQPFYKAKNGENGTLGLGLSLVRRVAEAHGGRAYARSRPEGGAVVGIRVPLET